MAPIWYFSRGRVWSLIRGNGRTCNWLINAPPQSKRFIFETSRTGTWLSVGVKNTPILRKLNFRSILRKLIFRFDHFYVELPSTTDLLSLPCSIYCPFQYRRFSRRPIKSKAKHTPGHSVCTFLCLGTTSGASASAQARWPN